MADITPRRSDPRAQDVLDRYATCFGASSLPVPVDAVASDLLGLRVELRDDLEVSGLLIPETMRVYVNAREAQESEGRRRFTVAHEIGHWVCQCEEGRVPPPSPIMCRDADLTDQATKDREREANNFAASLLMPEQQMRAMAAQGLGHDEMVAAFGVSDLTMHWRFINLGIIAAK